MDQKKQIIVTYCVDPLQFYFKYVDNCVNSEYSDFDAMLQLYGNGMHARACLPYVPRKRETIIFFDVMFSKWIRGCVLSEVDDDVDEIVLWCIDNG